jgi:phenylpropionate dioxygenase-like ring-hydroxylating dioxygenase large terminal subunit
MRVRELVKEGARFVDRAVYKDREVFEAEMKKVFSHAWLYLGHESELKNIGDYKTTAAAGQPMVLVRDMEGKVRVFYNTCRHRGTLLARENRGNCKFFRCMYHAWTYDLSGKLVSVPGPESYGSDFNRAEYSLAGLPQVETFCGLIFASLSSEVPPLKKFLGDAAPYIKEACEGKEIIGVNKVIFNGNWKIYRENFADGYHPNYLHKLLAAIGTYSQGVSADLGKGHGLLEWEEIQPDEKRYASAVGEAKVDAAVWAARLPKDKERVLTLFPNLAIPWILDAVSIHVLTPLAPDRTLLEIYFLGGIGDTKEIRDWRLALSMMWGPAGAVGVDDVEVMKECQAGLKADESQWVNIARGKDMGDRGDLEEEYAVRAFYKEWNRYMTA